jgi:hypothetical protein
MEIGEELLSFDFIPCLSENEEENNHIFFVFSANQRIQYSLFVAAMQSGLTGFVFSQFDGI